MKYVYTYIYIYSSDDFHPSKQIDVGVWPRVFDRIPLPKENLVENIPLAKDHFLIKSPFLYDFKVFYS